MKDFPVVFNDVKNEVQFTEALKYKKWVISNYSDIFNDGKTDSISDMMLCHQILYPQIKKMKFENQLKMVLKMAFTIVRANRVAIRGILTGATIDMLGFRSKTKRLNKQ